MEWAQWTRSPRNSTGVSGPGNVTLSALAEPQEGPRDCTCPFRGRTSTRGARWETLAADHPAPSVLVCMTTVQMCPLGYPCPTPDPCASTCCMGDSHLLSRCYGFSSCFSYKVTPLPSSPGLSECGAVHSHWRLRPRRRPSLEAGPPPRTQAPSSQSPLFPKTPLLLPSHQPSHSGTPAPRTPIQGPAQATPSSLAAQHLPGQVSPFIPACGRATWV